MGLRDKYAYAIQTCKGMFRGNAEERDGKLYFKGAVSSDAEKNKIWDAIKTIPDWQKEVIADITVIAAPSAPSATSGQMRTHTVMAGETLSKIAKDELGSAGAYMKIFEANKDQLQDPNMIKPGQVLRIPA
jgi:nucleoid-associated protein YgaU